MFFGHCISLRQVLKVGEWSKIPRNANTPQRNLVRSRKKKNREGDSHLIVWQAFLLWNFSWITHLNMCSQRRSRVWLHFFSAEVWLNRFFVLWDVFWVFLLAFLRVRHPAFPIKRREAPFPKNAEKLESCEVISHPFTLHNYFLL